MSRLRCVGLSHHGVALAVRERFAVPLAALAEVCRAVRATGAVEAVVLSTCNRVEVYAVVDAQSAPAALLVPLAARAGVAVPDAAPAVYEDREAVRHAFRVAAGLDAMVVGETQVLGQVREAYGAAAAAGTTGPRLNPLFQRALATAKAIHAETRIGAGRVSVAGVAVDLAAKVFGALPSVSALLIGTGDTGSLTLRHLRDAGIGRVALASRSAERAVAAAAAGGATPVAPEGLADALADADLVVAATDASQGPVLLAAQVREALRRRKQRPQVVIDLGVPRNVAPDVAGLDNVFAYDLDALQGVVAANLAARAPEVARAEAAVDAAVELFWRRHADGDVPATLAAVTRAVRDAAEAEVAACLARLPHLSAADRSEIARVGERAAARILSGPLAAVQAAAANGGAAELTAALRRLFAIERPGA